MLLLNLIIAQRGVYIGPNKTIHEYKLFLTESFLKRLSSLA